LSSILGKHLKVSHLTHRTRNLYDNIVIQGIKAGHTRKIKVSSIHCFLLGATTTSIKNKSIN
jgi:hypothetical protein